MKIIHSMVFIVIVPLILCSSAFAEKVCPKDGESYPDSVNFCGKHGVKLTSQIKIGVLFSISGSLRNNFGMDQVKSIDNLVDEINRTGGIKGCKLKIRAFDIESNLQIAKNRARQLVQDNVVITFGHSTETDVGNTVMAIFKEANIPYVYGDRETIHRFLSKKGEILKYIK